MTRRAAATLSLSLGEVEAAARKAARGVGYDWGHADHAGTTVRALCEIGEDGVGALVRLLNRVAEEPGCGLGQGRPSALAPGTLDGIWIGPAGALCALQVGTCLSDLARSLPEGGFGLQAVLSPVLLVPACADVARARGAPVTLTWRGGMLAFGETGIPLARSLRKLAQLEHASLHLYPGGGGLAAATSLNRALVERDDWETLLKFAARMYAPGSEASRLLGAGTGTGLNDND